MDRSNKEIFSEVIQLLKAGDTAAALPLLAKILKSDPNFVQAWYLLGMTIDDKEKKRRAFNQVLKLDPTHEKAKIQLEWLESDLTPSQEIEPETGPEPTSAPGVIPHDDFTLPDWMQESSFDPTEYSDDAQGLGSQPVYENTEADFPDWAQQIPLEPQAEELAVEDMPAFEMDSDLPEEEDTSLVPLTDDTELTGYYDDVEDEPEGKSDWLFDETEAVVPQEQPVAAFLDDDSFPDSEDDPQQDKPEWLRDMVEEDGNGKKKKKTKEKVPKKLLSPDQRRRRRKIITYIILLFAIAGLSYGGYYYQDELKPYVDPVLSPIKTWVAPVSDLLTQGAPLTYLLTPGYNITPTSTNPPPQQPTGEPTWTPAGNQAGGGIPPSNQVPTWTPTPMPTPLPLSEETIASMTALEEQVKTVRNLPGPLNIERELMTKDKLRAVMENQLIDEEVIERLKNDETVLRALGFINADYDLVQAGLNSRGDALGGYYDPDVNKINLIGGSFFGVEKYAYVHEYAHAIQDANFDLNRLGLFPDCAKPLQACLAARALVEGDASLVAQSWFQEFPPEEGAADIQDFQPPPALFEVEAEPAYFAMNTVFAYDQGKNFVEELYEAGGWNRVNRAYAALPETTEQILHPSKYLQGEPPVFLDHPDLSPVFAYEWDLIRRDSLGEWESYLLLAYNDYPAARQPETEAATAAEGWGADEYRVYTHPEQNDVFLSAYWIWDTAEDSDQFYNLMLSYVASRFGTSEVDGPGESGRCWYSAEQMSCVYQNDNQVLWLHSDNLEILEAAQARFTKFP
jgi:hypothetical protein